MSIDPDPDHPIIEKPWEYQLTEFHYHYDPDDWGASFLDMTLERGEPVRRLRFWSPRRLRIEEGFPIATSGMAIKDVRHRQMEGLGVYVGDFEASPGAVTFWAYEVVDLDTNGGTEGAAEEDRPV